MEFLDRLPNRLITARELSSITGIAAGTLGNWRSTGRGPAFLKIGGGVFYDPADVREFFMSIPKIRATWEGR
ncbi:helix-turn-helix domain-containing protein [Bifidobacterium dentium]|uniref:helix-turn-helix transcriptional regulator n=1 Tax=Bifidobacterium dentium TaxID=1689 RepID=UPI0018C2CA2B|nr:helix-turn-helix domain-containing protein [Bifidobacterium dentium]MBF9710188.1 helix-turn-helix domain-containing protein [Bifidobacterium dentium]